MQNQVMTETQMLAMNGQEAFYGPLLVLVVAGIIVSLIVFTVMWTKKRRAAKAQLQDS